MTLRPYQREAVESVYRHLRERDDNPCVVIPTGGGKTPVMATICRDAVNLWGGRVLVLAHVRELLEQAVDKLHAMAPDLLMRIGVYSAGLRSRDTEHPIIVAGIQSVYRRAAELDRFDLILIDEAHMIPPDGEGMYRTFLAEAKVVNPNVRLIGLTATPYRMSSGMICGPENLLNKVCYEVGVRELIVQGYLCPLRTKAGSEKADWDALHVRGGEYIAGEVETMMDTDGLVRAACAEVVEHTSSRTACLIFASGIEHGLHIQRVLQVDHGVKCGFVCGDTPTAERDETIREFREGRLPYLANVNVLTLGFDAPNVDCIAMLRPTLSPGLYYQMVGRGFRLAPGKTDCIAEGQRVLTDCGLAPIEKVTTDMRVWDGVEFVRHHGAVCRGEQEVIAYAGITATPDHRVWTEEGWKTLGQCAVEQAAVSVTGIGRAMVWQADGHFRRGGSQGNAWQTIPACAMRGLRGTVAKVPYQSDAAHGRLSKVRSPTTSSEMASAKGVQRERPLHESPQPAVLRLRRTRDRIPVRVAHGDGGLDARASRASPRHANRPHRQQRPLRAKQPAICDGIREPAEHATVQRMRVWDILNAGPRHRFTCEGLLVSNCLILDYGGNVLRHGPVDSLRIEEPGTGTGEAPAKECPKCHALIAAGYAVCPECGHVFPEREVRQHEAQASDAAILAGQVKVTEYPVEDVSYGVHTKRGAPEDAPKTMRVQYRIGFREWRSEWICFEHAGWPRAKAESWWRQRTDQPAPDTAAEAVEAAESGCLAAPVAVTIRSVSGEPFDQIVGYRFAPPPEPDAAFAPEPAAAAEPAGGTFIDDMASFDGDDIPF